MTYKQFSWYLFVFIIIYVPISCGSLSSNRLEDEAKRQEKTAIYYYDQEDYEKAKDFCKKALESWEKIKNSTIKSTPDWAIDNHIDRCNKILEQIGNKEGLSATHPDLSTAQQKSYKKYLDPVVNPHCKAFAVEIDGTWAGWGWGHHKPEHAIETAMQSCGRKSADCRLYAVGERVVTNFSQEQLSNFLREYYEEVFPPGDLRNIIQRALNGDEIKALITGREGEGFSKSTRWTMKFEDEGHFILQIIETKTNISPGNYEGEWWTEGDHYCRKYDKLYSGRTGCFYVIKEENGIAWYTKDGAFISRMRFTTPLSSE